MIKFKVDYASCILVSGKETFGLSSKRYLFFYVLSGFFLKSSEKKGKRALQRGDIYFLEVGHTRNKKKTKDFMPI